ncbi:DUF3147 family protein [Candidatus Uhrbacteria bacterium]|nr:DUF3147 family protein [Candidatus Uhrbacteria bacterium]
MLFIIKVFISALIIALVSELGKRFSAVAAILASLPLTSILAILWLYYDTKNVETIRALSLNIFWAVLPSLLFFIALPSFLKWGMKFEWAMFGASIVMVLGYTAYLFVLKKFGIAI